MSRFYGKHTRSVYEDGQMYPDENEIQWTVWERKFAILPKRLSNITICFGWYYEREGYDLYVQYVQRGKTVFDILKYK